MKIFISSRYWIILLRALTTLISLWWVSYEGSFQVCDGRWWKKIQECQALKLGDAPMHPKKYSRRLKRLSLGMPSCIHFSINNHQFVHLHAIFLSLHMLCAMLGASRYLLFSFVLVYFSGHNKSEPSLPCLGERHAPFHSRTQHSFSSLSFLCVLHLFVAIVILSS